MIEKVEHSLKYDSRIDGLSLASLMTLFGLVEVFLDKGEQWMGKCQTALPQILGDKYQQELKMFGRNKNGELKRVLFDEF